MFRVLAILVLCIPFSQLCFGQGTFERTPHWNADRNDNFYPHSELKELDERGFPVGWGDVSAFESGRAVVRDPAKGIIQLTCPDDGSETSISTTIDLPKRIKFVTVLTRMRGPTVELGDSDDAGAGVVYTLEMKSGKTREFPRVEPLYRYGSLGGWKTYRTTMRVLPGYVKLNVRAEINDSKGSFEVDRILVVSSEPGYQATPEERIRLMTAIQKDDDVEIAKLMEEQPGLLELRDGTMENGTPLILASWFNSVKVTKELIRLGANMEASDESWQNTPLAWCCWWGNPEVAEVLVDAGAKTKHYARMVASSKTQNRSPRGTPEDFDRIVEIIEAAQAAPVE
ncbi:ankyrin repeat domain-containing protein [Rhodopirellula sp. SWK7]|uniref:ankyrin repeat domain-containing protein n=1 Tax=Rhodopirellula sp. SWK7 TaxID=595460 RepID=UPI0002BE0882|nr:ankyrin repeat domain-containing protein [Rhodopirellula sp. SWK7]EMI40372.1 putative secreted protein [Rhodopirellula sp. SWK7]